MAYYLTINIEEAGTSISPDHSGGTSDFGHMWYSLLDESTNQPSNYGIGCLTWTDFQAPPGDNFISEPYVNILGYNKIKSVLSPKIRDWFWIEVIYGSRGVKR
jgi:hypothetical protein